MSWIQLNASGPEAAVCLADIVKPALGTRNKIKCIVDGDEEIFVKDTGLLLQNLDIEHPVGQYIVSVCTSFHTCHGTGTKSLLYMIGLFMKAALSLRLKGVPVSVVTRHLKECVRICCDKLEDMKISVRSELVKAKSEKSPDNGNTTYLKTETGKTTCRNNCTTRECPEFNKSSEKDYKNHSNTVCVTVGPMKTPGNELFPFKNHLKNCNNEADDISDHIAKLFIGKPSSATELDSIKESDTVFVQSCDVVHLNMTNQNLSEDDDTDWFFDTDKSNDINSYLKQFMEESDNKLGLKKSVAEKTEQNVVVDKKSHVAVDNQSDSDFDDCFDDIPTVIKFEFPGDGDRVKKEYSERSTNFNQLGKNTLSYKHTSQNSPVYRENESIPWDVISNSSKSDEFDSAFMSVELSHKSDQLSCDHKSDQLSCDHKSDQLSCDHKSDQLSCDQKSDQLSCDQKSPLLSDRFDFSKTSEISPYNEKIRSDFNARLNKRDVWESYLEANTDCNVMSSQGDNILSVKSSDSRLGADESFCSDKVKEKPKPEISLSEMDNFMRRLNIRKPEKSGTSMKILNSSRHFKTIDSTVQELKNTKLSEENTKSEFETALINISDELKDLTKELRVNSNSKSDLILFENNVNDDLVMAQKFRNTVKSMPSATNVSSVTLSSANAVKSMTSATNLVSSALSSTNEMRSVTNATLSSANAVKSMTGLTETRILPAVSERKGKEFDYSSRLEKSPATTCAINMTSVNSMLDKINHLQPAKGIKGTVVRNSLIRSRHFQENIQTRSEKMDHSVEMEILSDCTDDLPSTEHKVIDNLKSDRVSFISDKEDNLEADNLDKLGMIDIDIHETGTDRLINTANKVTETDAKTEGISHDSCSLSDVKTEKITLDNCIESLSTLACSLCHGDVFAMDMVVKVLINQWKDRMDTDIDEIRLDVLQLHCCTSLGPLSVKSDIVQGIVLLADSNMMSQIKTDKQLRTVIINGDVTPTYHHTGYKKTVESHVVNTLDEVVPSLYKGGNWLLQVQQLLKQYSIEVLMIKGSASDDVKVMCESCGIVVMEMVPYRALQTICYSADISMAVYITDICEDNICDQIRMRHFRDDWMLKNVDQFHVVVECGSAPIQTVLYSHPTQHACDLMEQEFWHCANLLSSALGSGYILPGAGLTEAECSEHLRQEADRRLCAINKTSCPDDLYFTSVLEEISKAFDEYWNVVLINSYTPGISCKSSLFNFDKNASFGDICNAQNLESCQRNSSHSKISQDFEKFSYNTTVDHPSDEEMDFVVKNEFTMEFDDCKEALLLDDYRTKLDSWNVAVNTVITILQTDSYIITGVTDEMKSDRKFKSDVIL